MKRPRLWEYLALPAISITIFLAIGAAINPVASITPRKISMAQSPRAARLNTSPAVVVATNTNYVNFYVQGLPSDYGIVQVTPYVTNHGRLLFINWSDDNGSNWHEGGLLLTNGFSKLPTNGHRIYRLYGAPLPNTNGQAVWWRNTN